MNRSKTLLALGGSLVMGMAGVANADENADLRTELQQVKARLAEIEGKQTPGPLDQRRAEEVKALIREVLADADTRSSLLAEGAVAGRDDKGFFIASADGQHRLGIWGQIQFRYLANFDQPKVEDGNQDSEDEGFSIRRARVGFKGYTQVGRKWDYEIVFDLDQSTSGPQLNEDGDTVSSSSTSSSVDILDVKIGTALSDGVRVDMGKFKLPFLREEVTSSSRQLAVERSFVTEYFTLNRAEQIQVSLGSDSDMVKGSVSISDGSNSEFSQLGADNVEFAITGRIDLKLSGNWSQLADYTSWQGEGNAVFLGAAVHYEMGDGNQDGSASNVPPDSDYLAWTVDGSLEMSGFGLSAAVIGGHTDTDSIGASDRDMFGFELQASYNIGDQFEPFARYEWIDTDVTGFDEVQILTIGVNYYFAKGHAAKFTADVVFFLDLDDAVNEDGDSISVGNPYGANAQSRGLGFSGDGTDEDTILLRLQMQLLF